MKKSTKFIILLFLCVLLVGPYYVKANGEENPSNDGTAKLQQGGDPKTGQVGSISTKAGKVNYSHKHLIGYRIYLAYDDGTIINNEKVNVLINYDYSVKTGTTKVNAEKCMTNIRMFSNNYARKEVIANGNLSPTIAPCEKDFITTGTFVGNLGSYWRAKANFNEAFEKRLIIKKKSTGEKYFYDQYSANGQASRITIKSRFQDFFNELGFSYTGEDLINDITNNKRKVYLMYEPLASFEKDSDKNIYLGTATELAKWLKDDIKDGYVNKFMEHYIIPAALTLYYSGAGYYPSGYEPPETDKTFPFTDNRYVAVTGGGDVRNGMIEGVAVSSWRLNDFLPDPPPKSSDCDYALENDNLTSCSLANSGKIYDKSTWKCIFESDSSKNDTTVRENYIVQEINNPYCKIYCKDEINIELPVAGAKTYAGTYIVVSKQSGIQNVGPVSYYGKRICRSIGNKADGTIDYEQIRRELIQANNNVKSTWDAYQKEVIKGEQMGSIKSSAYKVETCTSKGTHPEPVYSCSPGIEPVEVKSANGSSRYVCNSKNGKKQTDAEIISFNPVANCSKKVSFTLNTYNSGTYDGHEVPVDSDTYACLEDCSVSVITYSPKIASTKDAYEKAVDARNTILNQIKECNYYYNLYNDFVPEARLEYYDVVYKGTYKLSPTKEYKGKISYSDNSPYEEEINFKTADSYNFSIDDKNNYGNKNYDILDIEFGKKSEKIDYYDCGNPKTPCTTRELSYPENKMFEQVTTKNYYFELPDNLYQFTLKPSGQAVHSIIDEENYEFIPFSILPIHYSTPAGTYEYRIYTDTFGEKNKLSNIMLNGAQFNGTNYKFDKEYSCDYEVIPPEVLGGKAFIYRTISLVYPFPGESGKNRKQGQNWFYTEDNPDLLVDTYIKNNRDAVDYQVYKFDPMYEIDLTPSLMAKIKAYNRDKNEETGIYYKNTTKQRKYVLGYSDFNLTCKENNYEMCVSKTIRDWGVTGCAISEGNNNYNNCGNTSNWSLN